MDCKAVSICSNSAHSRERCKMIVLKPVETAKARAIMMISGGAILKIAVVSVVQYAWAISSRHRSLIKDVYADNEYNPSWPFLLPMKVTWSC